MLRARRARRKKSEAPDVGRSSRASGGLRNVADAMSTLSSSSTLEQVKAAYIDNASYAEDNSAAKARTFVTACRILLLKLPKRAAHGRGNEIELDTSLIFEEMRRA